MKFSILNKNFRINYRKLSKLIFYYFRLSWVIDEIFKKETSIKLRIYDLSNGNARIFSKSILGFQVDGIWHTSLEIFENEIWYGNNGIRKSEIGKSSHGEAIQIIEMGKTRKSQKELLAFLKSVEKRFSDSSYNLFHNNCNHFSEVFLKFLSGKEIPSHIMELPKIVEKNPIVKTLLDMLDIRVD